ncbi:MAG: tetratricopeptide repeat protein [Proteobacteria bacterium]|nr:tetratricopeptide repeat protein [Pseudomonadota bacterium]MBI3499274.1 tetratricopeptide repeat protein [Pseudomonadota bacterium]
MQKDIRGLPISAAGNEAADAFDQAIENYVKYRADTGELAGKLIAADPNFALGHCLKGYLTMLTYKKAYLGGAEACLKAARAHAANATPREKRHIDALAAWHSGAVEETLAIWEAILGEHPTDLLALRLAHFNYFWRGEAGRMRDSLLRTKGAWSPGMPGFETWLAMAAFGHEECGDYAEAERTGRRAVELDPADLWATHAVAHVLEMQGRHGEGIAWLEALQGNWDAANNMRHHLAWHRALYHLELGEFDRALQLYDAKIRPLDSPLVKAQPDLYIDIQNAASLLWRLEHLGVAVGERWSELGEKAEGRIGDHLQLFTLPHFMMALAASGRWQSAQRMLQAMREEAAAATSPHATILGTIAVPICEAAIAHRKGEHGRVVELIQPIRDELWRLGASHAQRDLFDQLFADSALIAGRRDVLASLVPKLMERGRQAPAGRKAYAKAAGFAA